MHIGCHCLRIKMGRKSNTQVAEEQTKTSIDRLLAKRRQLVKQFETYREFYTSVFLKKNEDQLTQLQVRTEKIENSLDQVNEIDLEIGLLHQGSVIDDDFEDLFYHVISDAKNYISEIKNRNHEKNQAHMASFSQDNVPNHTRGNFAPIQGGARLPNLGLPCFKGEYNKWTQFKETFDTLIGKNPSLDDIQKFYYLLDTVEGDARNLLDSLEITRENYEVAWQLLENRFNNKPVIIQSHLRAIVDAPAIVEESHIALRNIVDNLERSVRSLKVLGEPVEYWNRLLIFIYFKKLDYETKKQWEETNISKFQGDPTLKDFLDFILNKCRVLENIEINTKSSGQRPYFKSSR